MKTLALHRRSAQERGNKSVGGEKRPGALSDASDDAVLIRERIATRLEHDLLECGHVSRLCGATDRRDEELPLRPGKPQMASGSRPSNAERRSSLLFGN
jgi:hypothetical protein